MKTSQGSEPTDMSSRLREVDEHARLMLAQREAARREPEVAEAAGSAPRFPAPRRARAFLFHGSRTGCLANVTLVAPVPPATS